MVVVAPDFPALDFPAAVLPEVRVRVREDFEPDVLPVEVLPLEPLPLAPAVPDADLVLVVVVPASAIPAHPPVHVAERVVRLSPGCFLRQPAPSLA